MVNFDFMLRESVCELAYLFWLYLFKGGVRLACIFTEAARRDAS